MTEPKEKWCIFWVLSQNGTVGTGAACGDVGGGALADSDLENRSPRTLDILTRAAALSHIVILGKITSILIPARERRSRVCPRKELREEPKRLPPAFTSSRNHRARRPNLSPGTSRLRISIT